MSIIILFGIMMIFCCIMPMVFMSLNRDKNKNHSDGCSSHSHNNKDVNHVEIKEK